MKRMDPNIVTMTVVLVVATVAFSAWALYGVIKDEIDGAARNQNKHRE